MKNTARAAAKLGVETVVGFTGSSIWKYVAMFPPASRRWSPPATRTSPTAGTRSSTSSTSGRAVRPRGAPERDRLRLLDDDAALEAIGHREAFGLNWDPSHSCGRTSTPWASSGTSRTGSTTSTARTQASDRQRPQRPAGLAPAVGRPAPRLGLRLDRARRRAVGAASGCSTRSATTARSRWSGRTPAWTGWSGRRRRWSSSGGSPSTPPDAAFDAAFSNQG